MTSQKKPNTSELWVEIAAEQAEKIGGGGRFLFLNRCQSGCPLKSIGLLGVELTKVLSSAI